MDDDFASLRKRVMLDSAAAETKLIEIHALSEQAIDAHAMLSNGLQIVQQGQLNTGLRIDGLVRDMAEAKAERVNDRRAIEGAFGGVSKELRYMRVTVFVLLLAIVSLNVYGSRPAQAMIATVWP